MVALLLHRCREIISCRCDRFELIRGLFLVRLVIGNLGKTLLVHVIQAVYTLCEVALAV